MSNCQPMFTCRGLPTDPHRLEQRTRLRCWCCVCSVWGPAECSVWRGVAACSFSRVECVVTGGHNNIDRDTQHNTGLATHWPPGQERPAAGNLGLVTQLSSSQQSHCPSNGSWFPNGTTDSQDRGPVVVFCNIYAFDGSPTIVAHSS